ncbi:MAG: ABC transporter permease subunit [Clostridiales bacterium]|nr:ABC transporter permease subunit [Clostridiales bacterium]
MNVKANKLHKLWRGLLIALFWLGVWQLVYLAVNKAVILPSPIATFKAFFLLLGEKVFWLSAGASLLRIMTGFCAALLCGSLLAVATHRISLLKGLFNPLLTLIKATPVASFIILALIWLPDDNIPVWTSFLMVLPIIWANLAKGLENIDANLLAMASLYKMPLSGRISRIFIPSLMPYFMAGAVTAIGLAWKAGIAAEVLCTPNLSIGGKLLDSKIYLEMPELFAWTMLIIILSMILEHLFVSAMRRLGKTMSWR